MRMAFCLLLIVACADREAIAQSPQPVAPRVSATITATQRTFVEQVTGLSFVLVPSGHFCMGSRFAENLPENEGKWFVDEAPPHEVSITRGFWLATTETTQSAFRRFTEETGYVTTAELRGESLGEYSLTVEADGTQSGHWITRKGLSWRSTCWQGTDDHPVTHVSWEDSTAFIQWLRDKTGRPFRLPTEAEWEYAAGGPDHAEYSWGRGMPVSGREGNIADARFSMAYPLWKYPVLASLDDGYVHTAPVGSFKANGYGLFDMSGNVWEWCADRYASDYYAKGVHEDPQGPEVGEERVQKGGGFDWELPYLRVAKRRRGDKQATSGNVGFRIAMQTDSAPVGAR